MRKTYDLTKPVDRVRLEMDKGDDNSNVEVSITMAGDIEIVLGRFTSTVPADGAAEIRDMLTACLEKREQLIDQGLIKEGGAT